MSQPRGADSVAERKASRLRTERVDDADDLMSGNDEWTTRREVALGEVEIGPADAARTDPQSKLPPTRVWNLALNRYERA
jgi:hypothetical protein